MTKEYRTINGPAFAAYCEGKKQADVGEEFGIHATTVSAYLKEGKVPVYIERLAEFLMDEQEAEVERITFIGRVGAVHFHTLKQLASGVGCDLQELKV